jgi:hypothetical protein
MEIRVSPADRYASLPQTKKSENPFIFNVEAGYEVFAIINGWWELCTVQTVTTDGACTVSCQQTTSNDGPIVASVNYKTVWPCTENYHPFQLEEHDSPKEKGPWDAIYAGPKNSPGHRARKAAKAYENAHGTRETDTPENNMPFASGPDVFILVSLAEMDKTGDKSIFNFDPPKRAWSEDEINTKRWLNFRAMVKTKTDIGRETNPRYLDTCRNEHDFRKDMYLDLNGLPPEYYFVEFPLTWNKHIKTVNLNDQGKEWPRLLECILGGSADEGGNLLERKAKNDIRFSLDSLLSSKNNRSVREGHEYSELAARQFDGRSVVRFKDCFTSQCVMGKYAFQYMTYTESDLPTPAREPAAVAKPTAQPSAAPTQETKSTINAIETKAEELERTPVDINSARTIVDESLRSFGKWASGKFNYVKSIARITPEQTYNIKIEYVSHDENLIDWISVANEKLVINFLKSHPAVWNHLKTLHGVTDDDIESWYEDAFGLDDFLEFAKDTTHADFKDLSLKLYETQEKANDRKARDDRQLKTLKADLQKAMSTVSEQTTLTKKQKSEIAILEKAKDSIEAEKTAIASTIVTCANVCSSMRPTKIDYFENIKKLKNDYTAAATAVQNDRNDTTTRNFEIATLKFVTALKDEEQMVAALNEFQSLYTAETQELGPSSSSDPEQTGNSVNTPGEAIAPPDDNPGSPAAANLSEDEPAVPDAEGRVQAAEESLKQYNAKYDTLLKQYDQLTSEKETQGAKLEEELSTVKTLIAKNEGLVRDLETEKKISADGAKALSEWANSETSLALEIKEGDLDEVIQKLIDGAQTVLDAVKDANKTKDEQAAAVNDKVQQLTESNTKLTEQVSRYTALSNENDKIKDEQAAAVNDEVQQLTESNTKLTDQVSRYTALSNENDKIKAQLEGLRNEAIAKHEQQNSIAARYRLIHMGISELSQSTVDKPVDLKVITTLIESLGGENPANITENETVGACVRTSLLLIVDFNRSTNAEQRGHVKALLKQLWGVTSELLRGQPKKYIDAVIQEFRIAMNNIEKSNNLIEACNEKLAKPQTDPAVSTFKELCKVSSDLSNGISKQVTSMRGCSWKSQEFLNNMKLTDADTKSFDVADRWNPFPDSKEFVLMFDKEGGQVSVPSTIDACALRDSVLNAGIAHKEHVSKHGFMRLLKAVAALRDDDEFNYVPRAMCTLLETNDTIDVKQLVQNGLKYEQIYAIAFFLGKKESVSQKLIEVMFAEVGITTPTQIRINSPTPKNQIWEELIENCTPAWQNATLKFNYLERYGKKKSASAIFDTFILGGYTDYEVEFATCYKLWKKNNYSMPDDGSCSFPEYAALERLLARGLPYVATYERILREDHKSDFLLPKAVVGHDRTFKLWKLYTRVDKWNKDVAKEGDNDAADSNEEDKGYSGDKPEFDPWFWTQLTVLWDGGENPFDATELEIVMMCLEDLNDFPNLNFEKEVYVNEVAMLRDTLTAANRTENIKSKWYATISEWIDFVNGKKRLYSDKVDIVELETHTSLESCSRRLENLLNMLEIVTPVDWPDGCNADFKYVANCAQLREHMAFHMAHIPATLVYDKNKTQTVWPLYLYDALTQTTEDWNDIDATTDWYKLPYDTIKTGPPAMRFNYLMYKQLYLAALATARQLKDPWRVSCATEKLQEQREENGRTQTKDYEKEKFDSMERFTPTENQLIRVGELVYYGGKMAKNKGNIDVHAGNIAHRAEVARKMGYFDTGKKPDVPTALECRSTGLQWLQHVQTEDDVKITIWACTIHDIKVQSYLKVPIRSNGTVGYVFETLGISTDAFGPCTTQWLREFKDLPTFSFIGYSKYVEENLTDVNREVTDATGGIICTIAEMVVDFTYTVKKLSDLSANENMLKFAEKIGKCRIGNKSVTGNFPTALKYSKKFIGATTMTDSCARAVFLSAWVAHYRNYDYVEVDNFGTDYAAIMQDTPDKLLLLHADAAPSIKYSAATPPITYASNGLITSAWKAELDVDGFWPIADLTVTTRITVDASRYVHIRQCYVVSDQIDVLATPSTVSFYNEPIPREGIDGILTGSHETDRDVRITVVAPRTLRVAYKADESTKLPTRVPDFMQNEIEPVKITREDAVYNSYTKNIGPNTVPTRGSAANSVNLQGIIFTSNAMPDNFEWEIEHGQYNSCDPLYIYWDDDTEAKTPSTLRDSNGVIRWARIRIATQPWLKRDLYNTFSPAYEFNDDCCDAIKDDIGAIKNLLIAGQYNTVKYYASRDGLPDCPIVITTSLRKYIKAQLESIKRPVVEARSAGSGTLLYIL